jgi:branched-chain amino acid transport system permease protein
VTAVVRRHSTRIMTASFLLIAVLGPLLVTSDRWLRVLALVVVYAVLASGLNLLVGYAGLLDLGYIAFFTIGAYFTSLIVVRLAIDQWGATADQLWWLFFVNLFGAGLCAALFGVVLGYPTLRARGDYLAIMTLAFGEVVREVAINWEGLTNGVIGIRGVPTPQIGGEQLLLPIQLYYVAFGIAVFALLVIARIVRSHVGRAWVALREDQVVAESVGIDSHRYKLLAYASGAFFAGMIGAFFAHMQQFVNPDSFALQDNFVVLSLVILGGAGTLWGPVVGAALWIVLQEWAGDLKIVQDHPELRFMVLGAAVIVLLRFMPRGIVRAHLRGRPGEIAPAGATAAESGLATAGEVPKSSVGGFELGSPDTQSTEPLLEVKDLSCRFGGVRALADVDVQLYPGEVLGVMGPNGAGKTTLFDMLSGVQRVQAGALVLRGRVMTGWSAHRLSEGGIARTFQHLRLIGDLTALENVLVAGHKRLRANVLRVVARTPGVSAAERRALNDARAALAYVGVADHADTPAGALSYGDQRRVEIARALMTRPRVLLLDEPAAGMNPTETRALADLIRRIRDDGVAVVLIEHDMSLLLEISDRVIVLDHGEKIAEGAPHEVQRDERVLEAYLGAPA